MGVFGAGNKKAGKLSLDKVAEIRQLYGQGCTQGALCRLFGVSINTIGRIVRGETWSQGAELRDPTEEEIKASQLRVMASVRQFEREKTFEAAAGHAPLVERASPPAVVGTHEQALVSEQAKATRDRLLGYKVPPSPLDGGDAPSEGTGEGLAKLEQAAVAEGLDVEVALRRGTS